MGVLQDGEKTPARALKKVSGLPVRWPSAALHAGARWRNVLIQYAMVARSRFFAASLWAALGPVGMLVLCAAAVVLFPSTMGEVVLKAGELILLGVPVAYTAVVVATYGIGRGLYELRLLTRTALAISYIVLVVSAAAFMTWGMAAGETIDVARSFALFLALGLVAAGSAAVVWWRVASRGVTAADLDDEPDIRMRRRQRKSFFRRLANKL